MYKSIIKSYIITILAILIPASIAVYVSDPYMLFHEHWFHKGKIYQNFRIQNYGLIKYGDFDSIIMGTSMLENTSANEASEKLGSKFANLSTAGSSFFERYKMLDFALNTKPIKHIILSLDYYFFQARKTNFSFAPELYEQNNLLGKVKVYTSDKAFKCIFKNKKCDFIEADLDRPNAWLNTEINARRFGGFQNWLKYYTEDEQIQAAITELRQKDTDYSYEFAAYKKIIDTELLPLFKHQETTFSLIIPPYSAIRWAKRKENLKEILKPYAYIVEKTADLKNVKIYWFYEEDYVFDIANYKDTTHYHYSVNSLQLDAIKEGSHILTLKNMDKKFADFITRINDYDLEPFMRQLPKE